MMDISTLETIGEGALEVGLTLVGMAFPVAIPFIAIAREAMPALIAARPYIIKAVENGTSTFHAAEAASPGLGDKIKAIAKQIDPKGVNYEQHLENVTKATAGFAVPGWTDQETQKWIDNATPMSDQDSRFGGG